MFGDRSVFVKLVATLCRSIALCDPHVDPFCQNTASSIKLPFGFVQVRWTEAGKMALALRDVGSNGSVVPRADSEGAEGPPAETAST